MSCSLSFSDERDPLATQNLTRILDGQALVEDVSIEVQAEEVFVVFGPSGSGKTSLLRLLNRLDEPTAGTVQLDGTDYREIPPRTLRQRVGWVPQQPTLVEGTVSDNVAWGPTLRDEPVDEHRVEGLLDRLGLAGFWDRDADRLSGGESQRVAIARTLFNDPDVVLLDEPTVRSLIPVGSLVIANAMKINGLALDRFRSQISDHRDEIQVGLSLGGAPSAVLARPLRESVRGSLIPLIDSLNSLGWVWIPGIMVGMILGGANPVYAALYQFVIMAMIFAAGGLTSMISSLLMGQQVMTDAEQLRRVRSSE